MTKRLRLLVLAGCWVAVLATAMSFVVDAMAEGYEWINHDSAHFVYSGRQLLAGRGLYVDWYSVNPPTMFMTAMATGWVASWAGVSDILTFHLAVVALAGFGLWFLQRRVMRESPAIELAMVCGAYAAAVLSVGLARGQFGQREHLFILLYLPYFAWRSRAQGLGAAAGVLLVLLGVFSASKPHFLAIVVATEGLTRFWHPKPPSLRTLAFVFGGVALPLVALAAHSPQSVRALFLEVLPYHLSGHYAYRESFYDFFFLSTQNRYIVFGVLCLSANLWVARFFGRGDRCLSVTLAAVVVLMYATIVHQHKFWTYHTIPVLSFLIFANALVVARWVTLPRAPLLRWLWLFPTAAVALVGIYGLVGRYRRLGAATPPVVQLLEAHVSPGERVVFYDTNMGFIHAALHLDLEIVGPWSIQYHLPSVIQAAGGDIDAGPVDEYVQSLAQTLDSERPSLLVFGGTAQAIPRPIHEIFVDRHGLLSDRPYTRFLDEAYVGYRRQE